MKNAPRALTYWMPEVWWSDPGDVPELIPARAKNLEIWVNKTSIQVQPPTLHPQLDHLPPDPISSSQSRDAQFI